MELYTQYPVFRGETEGDQIIKIAQVMGPPSLDDLEELITDTPIKRDIVTKIAYIG
jgi:hypothetical protein